MKGAAGWVALFVFATVTYAVLWRWVADAQEPPGRLLLRGALFAVIWVPLHMLVLRRRGQRSGGLSFFGLRGEEHDDGDTDADRGSA